MKYKNTRGTGFSKYRKFYFKAMTQSRSKYEKIEKQTTTTKIN